MTSPSARRNRSARSSISATSAPAGSCSQMARSTSRRQNVLASLVSPSDPASWAMMRSLSAAASGRAVAWPTTASRSRVVKPAASACCRQRPRRVCSLTPCSLGPRVSRPAVWPAGEVGDQRVDVQQWVAGPAGAVLEERRDEPVAAHQLLTAVAAAGDRRVLLQVAKRGGNGFGVGFSDSRDYLRPAERIQQADALGCPEGQVEGEDPFAVW